MADRNSIGNIVKVALAVCLVCAVVVSTSAVTLRPLQEKNRVAFRQVNILQTAGMFEPGMNVQAAFEGIEQRFVNMDSGEYVEVEPGYDPQKAARDPAQSIVLSEDPAGIGRRPNVADVYLARDDQGRLSRLILPVQGYGLWSTMYGFLSLEADLNTISGIRFYEHGETPGLGGEIDNPRWQASWVGTEVRDSQGNMAFRIDRGRTPEGVPDAMHRIDGLSGATITSQGVNNMVRFWLGEQGYGPYLARLQQRIESGEVN